jgi:hypothetical protein
MSRTYDHEHRKTTPVRSVSSTGVGTNGGSDEDHDHGLEDHEHNTRLSAKVHEPSSGKTSNGEETLSNGVEVGSLDVRICSVEIWACLLEVVDEVSRNTDLRTDIGELGKCTPEQSVLLAEWLVNVSSSSGGHLSLVGHVGVCNFGNGGEEEDDGEDGDESSDTEIYPLHGFERFAIFSNVLEDDLSSEDGSND